jgi:hypothetical protein
MIVVYIVFFIKLQLIFLFVAQIKKAGRRDISEGIVCCRLMEPISGKLWDVANPSGATSSRGESCNMRWGFV